MPDPATAKAQAVGRLDEVARSLKRQIEASKWALRTVRQAQAELLGIQVNTQPREGGQSVNPSTEEEARGSTRAA